MEWGEDTDAFPLVVQHGRVEPEAVLSGFRASFRLSRHDVLEGFGSVARERGARGHAFAHLSLDLGSDEDTAHDADEQGRYDPEHCHLL